MKPADAGILLLSNGVLMSGVLGEALPPESIPIQCATICGPMVELTSICSGGSSRGNSVPFLNSRRKRENENQNTGAEGKEKPKRQPKNGGELGKRNFTVIVPAPTSFPSSPLVQQGTMNPPRPSKITIIRPTVIFPVQETPSQPPLPSPPPPSSSSSSSSSSAPPPPVATPAPTQQHPSTSTPAEPDEQQNCHSTTGLVSGSVSPTTSHHPRSSVDAINDGGEGDDDDGDDDGDDQTNISGAQSDKNEDGWMMRDGEEECVCENKSFNVARVAALCSSCIATALDQQNDVAVIMSTCKFTPEKYSPEKDSIVNKIHVEAVPPKAIWGQNAGIAKAGAAMLMPAQGVQMAVGAALSFFHLWLL